MLDIFVRIIDSIFPIHPSVGKIRKEKPEEFIRFFSPYKFAGCFVLSDYTNEFIKSAIHANKFHNDLHATKLLASLVDKWLQTLPTTQQIIFIPIPLSKKRLKERGYNQTLRVVNNLATNKNILIVDGLKRIRHTIPQTKLDRKNRLNNVHGIFECKDLPKDTLNSLIVLIDDVITTGATMREACQTLKSSLSSEYEVVCVALAH